VERYESQEVKPTKIAGFDARGFLFGPTIAMRLGECSIIVVVVACVFCMASRSLAARARSGMFICFVSLARSLARSLLRFRRSSTEDVITTHV